MGVLLYLEENIQERIKIEKVPCGGRSEKAWQAWECNWSQQVKHNQVRKGTGQGVRKEWASPASMLHPSQMLYGNVPRFDKRSNSV